MRSSEFLLLDFHSSAGESRGHILTQTIAPSFPWGSFEVERDASELAPPHSFIFTWCLILNSIWSISDAKHSRMLTVMLHWQASGTYVPLICLFCLAVFACLLIAFWSSQPPQISPGTPTVREHTWDLVGDQISLQLLESTHGHEWPSEAEMRRLQFWPVSFSIEIHRSPVFSSSFLKFRLENGPSSSC